MLRITCRNFRIFGGLHLGVQSSETVGDLRDFSHKKASVVNYGLFVRRPIGANQGLNFNPGFFFLCEKPFSPIIFSIHFRAFNHQIADQKNLTEFAEL